MAWSVQPLNNTVEREILELPADLLAKFYSVADLIRDFGPHAVPRKFWKPVSGHRKLFEMRMEARGRIARALCTPRRGRIIVVLTAFTKKDRALKRRDIIRALARMKELDQ